MDDSPPPAAATRHALAAPARTAAPADVARTRLASLDGWRALSILLVLGSHCGAAAGFPESGHVVLKWLFDGDLGVRTFLVISGLLITWLLLAEHDRSGRVSAPGRPKREHRSAQREGSPVSLRRFYARRALRILPVYAAYLATLAVLQALTPLHETATAWMGYLTFTTNFVGAGTWPGGHLWSLAVEEQFYLLWPTLFVALALATNLRRSLWWLALPMVVAPAARVVWFYGLAPAPVSAAFTGYSFFNYFDSLAVGCAAAVLLARRADAVRRWATDRPRALLCAALALIAFPYVCTRLLALVAFVVPFGNLLQAIGLAALIVQSVLVPRFAFYAVLNRPAVRFVGALSYSLYIWQQLFCTQPQLLGLREAWWLSFPWWLLPTFAVAVASHYLLERPLFRIRARLR